MTQRDLSSQHAGPDGTTPVPTEAALESWKEIAAYLQRDVRTVTRWEKMEHLPVHRHRHLARSSVYAYPSQLDAWRERRKPEADDHPRRVWWHPVPTFAVALIFAISLVSVATGRRVGAAGDAGMQVDNKPQFRQVHIATAVPNTGGKLSPDGEKLAFVSGGSLWVAPLYRSEQPMRTGTPVRLTEPMGAWDVGGAAISWSHDGKWIAFRALKPGTTDNPALVYVIPSSGGLPRQVTLTESLQGFWRYRMAISPDGGKVYHVVEEVGRPRIYETAVGATERRLVTEPDTEQPAISPDGARIAYLKSDAASWLRHPRQLWVKPVDVGDPVLVCEGRPGGFIRGPVWSPDGSKIALLVKSPDNDLVECTEIWIVLMGPDGRPSGAPSTFALRTNTNDPIAGWTGHNEIGLLFKGPQNSGLYAVPAAGGQAVQITDRWSTYPRWSPDDRTIYYRADADTAYRGLFRVPAEGGSRAEIYFQEALGIPIPGGGPSLSPDGTQLCFTGVRRSDVEADKGFPPALYVIDSRGGEPIRLTEPGSGAYAPTWSPDGKKIAFTRYENVPGERAAELFVMPAGGGAPLQISSLDDQVEGSSAEWSPDGELIAYLGRDNTLRVIPAAGGRSRVLASDLGRLRGHGLTWSPDGQEIAFTAGTRIWKVSRGGGEPREIRTGLLGTPGQIDWSHDGKRLVFEFGSVREIELWLMTGFRDPEIAKAANAQVR